jgi:hypothetical protein
MHDPCRATTRDGKPCSGQARPGSSYCPWHDPELAEQRAAWRRKGGEGRSNAARARKQLSGDIRDLTDVKAILLRSMTAVEGEQLAPGAAQALASLARAIVVVSGAGDFEDRLAALEAATRERPTG